MNVSEHKLIVNLSELTGIEKIQYVFKKDNVIVEEDDEQYILTPKNIDLLKLKENRDKLSEFLEYFGL